MINSPLMVGGAAAPRLAEAERPDADMRTREPAAAPDDAPVEPASPEFDRGLEDYQRSLAAYSPTPLAVSLLVLASQFDGRVWVRLSGDAELVEIPGGHFDWVTGRNQRPRSLFEVLAGRERSRGRVEVMTAPRW